MARAALKIRAKKMRGPVEPESLEKEIEPGGEHGEHGNKLFASGSGKTRSVVNTKGRGTPAPARPRKR